MSTSNSDALEFKARFEERIANVNDANPNARKAVAYGVALAWRTFLVRFKSVEEFRKITQDEKFEYLKSWAAFQNKIVQDTNDNEVALGVELFKMYLTPMISGDFDIANDIAEKLEPLNYEGSELMNFFTTNSKVKS